MDEPTINPKRHGSFLRGRTTASIVPENPVEDRLMREYGAVFVAAGGVIAPDKIVYRDEDDVQRFQRSVETRSADLGGLRIELQAAAMDALEAAINAARSVSLDISPRGPDSARRNYSDTVDLWRSRVEPGLEHWLGNDRITEDQARIIRDLSPYEQVPVIFELEAEGIFFAKDLSKSIIYSVAPPGTSQHLSMLAIDIEQHADPDVRSIMADHGWFQTVFSDLPHFTFLGMAEAELPGTGLKQIKGAGRTLWVPDI